MLIVIVIIGILAATIIPKIIGVLARARDTQRVADLRNIASAIELYRADYGVLPPLSRSQFHPDLDKDYFLWESASYLSGYLNEYITALPKDPQKNNLVKIYRQYWHYLESDNLPFGVGKRKWVIKEWEYVYHIFKKNGDKKGAAVLVAKVETPSMANFVLKYYKVERPHWVLPPFLGSAWVLGTTTSSDVVPHDIDDLSLCTSVKKVSQWEDVVPATAKNSECAYSSEEQLYYVLKIE